MRISATDSTNDRMPTPLALDATETNHSAVSGSALQPASGSGPTGASLAIDSTAISPTASLVSETMSLPEVNSTRVSDVQAALQLGHFLIDNGSVATALISSMLDGAWG